jgi:hypothetical protein
MTVDGQLSRVLLFSYQLAEGQTTSATAAKFGVSLGRISQLRRELRDAWQQFHGECAVGLSW